MLRLEFGKLKSLLPIITEQHLQINKLKHLHNDSLQITLRLPYIDLTKHKYNSRITYEVI